MATRFWASSRSTTRRTSGTGLNTDPWRWGGAPCAVIRCHVLSCAVMRCHALSCAVMRCHALSCAVMRCHALSRAVMCCHILSRIVMCLLLAGLCGCSASFQLHGHWRQPRLLPCHHGTCHALSYLVMPCHGSCQLDLPRFYCHILLHSYHALSRLVRAMSCSGSPRTRPP